MRRRHVVLLGASAWSAGWALAQPSPGGAAPPIRVAAASDLKFALADAVRQFQLDTGVPVVVTYGSSGQFARQIAQGLPADLFMSADEALVLQLAQQGLTQGTGALYAQGRLTWIVPQRTALAPWSAAQADLREGRLSAAALDLLVPPGSKLAIAHPEHAPYGRAAQQALQAMGLWDRVQSRLVLGDNIAQATQFVSTGAASAGISALSLALAPELAPLIRHEPLPERLHAPLRQRMVLLKNARPRAQQLFDYLQSAPVQARWQTMGFTKP